MKAPLKTAPRSPRSHELKLVDMTPGTDCGTNTPSLTLAPAVPDRGAARAMPPSQRPARLFPIFSNPRLLASAALLLAATGFPIAHAQPRLAPDEVQIERTMLPEAHAGSFAFGLPGGVNVCYDPVRGGVNYIWTGGFIALTNVRPVNKLIKAADLLGPIVHREAGTAPLRRADAARVPVLEFAGYTLRPGAVELRYTVDGVPVREELRAAPDGRALVRTFRFDRTGADTRWWFVVEGQPPRAITPQADGTFVLTTPLPARSVP